MKKTFFSKMFHKHVYDSEIGIESVDRLERIKAYGVDGIISVPDGTFLKCKCGMTHFFGCGDHK
jgi:hypothetical protein